MSFW
ncbi:hypothetical protein D047_3212A, partial [Vibrio parahaemolyticus VPTS-2010_2]|jgi:hypothetical protein